MGIEERLSSQRCTTGGGIRRPTDVGLLSAVASGVKFITGDGQNVPRYSS